MLQFNPTAEVKSLSKAMLMMDLSLPIFDDPMREQYHFQMEKDQVKDLAVRT